MLKTFKTSFSLLNTYRVNTILYSLKQIPLIRRILPNKLYSVRGLKVFANIIAILWEIISAFLGKLLYVLLMVFMMASLYSTENTPAVFLHIFLFLTIIGAFVNTYMFNPTKDKYYAMIQLRMNAKEYTLTDYTYTMLKTLIGFMTFMIIFGRMSDLPLWQCILAPFFVLGLKMTYVNFMLRDYEKNGKATNENKIGVARWIIIGVLLLAAYVPPIFDIYVPQVVATAIMALSIITGLLSIKKIVTFKYYYPVYREILIGNMMFQMDNTAVKVAAEQSRKLISTDTDITSTKKGYEYLNDLFVKRHKKILWSSSIKIALVSLGLVIAAVIALLFVPDEHAEVNEIVLTFLPYFVFIMYAINRGTGFTRALFINCDHCLLTYSFFKQPKHILKLFKIRLREIIKINLLPALVIGGGLAALLFITGGTDNPLNYAVLFVSIICMSIFFSVHYLTLYYLLQPYNAGTELKGGTYKIITSATYVVCYVMMQLRFPTFTFGLITIIFCVLYSIIACILIYKLAPKTFRIRA